MHTFLSRHIGANKRQEKSLLKAIKELSIEALIDKTIPENIRLKKPFEICDLTSEFEFEKHINELAQKNKLYKSFIGQGYYGTITPNVIKRNILENPGWYTAYTPYQAEISQGRLEALLNFQTMISELTAMPIANASLLDEATAAAEAMIMFYNTRSRAQQKSNVCKFWIDENCFEQTIEVLQTRAEPLGIQLVIESPSQAKFDDSYFGAISQYPNKYGEISNLEPWVTSAQKYSIKTAIAADLMSLALLKAPGEYYVDAVVGSTQRFGVPMGFGGPHAAYFATKEAFKRNIPGRIIGVSLDRHENPALRMALQTREQHIRRDKATSNICTAQALLAIMASMYAVYHGPQGIYNIAKTIFDKTTALKVALEKMGYKIINKSHFDTISIAIGAGKVSNIKMLAKDLEINLYYHSDAVSISVDETISEKAIKALLTLFSKLSNKEIDLTFKAAQVDKTHQRTSEFLTHSVFNRYHTETEMMRYIKRLENKDISLTRSMISLGSCTMKLNAAAELYPISIAQFAYLHPFAPKDQSEGYQEVFKKLNEWLSKITGFAAMSLQPNSGAQGEYTGLMVIRAYHKHNKEDHRNIALIPSSAHGTNPASAVMAGMKVVVVQCDQHGNIDVDDLKAKAEQHSKDLSCLMVTYPSTHGVFEQRITEITEIIHQHGGQVYMDGANMNAQVGLTSPGLIGADVCHLNLHKTFAIPHGGGGPGMGPIGVAEHLVDFLPGHKLTELGTKKSIKAVAAAPYGSALILLISYAYIKLLGSEGLKKSTQIAILNANYMKARLEDAYEILYTAKNGTVAHEMIVDCRPFKQSAGIEVEDIAKRLMDYGFHAPTMSFPVAGTMMIEPTESESIEELDRFCEAMLEIRKEIAAIENGKVDKTDNVLKNAPHTAEELVSDWPYSYNRKQAVFPLTWVSQSKYWPPVKRVDNAHGDRNLVCTCPPIESYQMA